MAACILFSCRNDLPFWTGYQWRGKFRHTTLPTWPTEASQGEKESIREAQNKTRREAPRKKTTENKNTEAARPKGRGLLEKPPTVYYWGILFFTKKNDKFIKHALMAKSSWSIEEKTFSFKIISPLYQGLWNNFHTKVLQLENHEENIYNLFFLSSFKICFSFHTKIWNRQSNLDVFEMFCLQNLKIFSTIYHSIKYVSIPENTDLRKLFLSE